MKIGVIADIHNNVTALQAVLTEFSRERADGVICCGDLLGIGPRPEETIQTVKAIPNLIACVCGNHDRYLVEGIPGPDRMGEEEIHQHEWEFSILSDSSKQFIHSLPYELATSLCGWKLYITHYSMDQHRQYVNYTPNPDFQDAQKIFPGQEADLILYGHDHSAAVNHQGDRWYINPGSLGCPGRDLNLARAGLLTLGDGQILYQPVSVRYGVQPVLDDINARNYPAKDEILRFFYGQ